MSEKDQFILIEDYLHNGVSTDVARNISVESATSSSIAPLHTNSTVMMPNNLFNIPLAQLVAKLDRKSDLYALFDVLQLETKLRMISMSGVHTQSAVEEVHMQQIGHANVR